MSALPPALREVFVTAQDVSPRWQLAMQAAFQEHTDAAIAKTILLPASAGPEQVRLVFDLAARGSLIGLTCYRDGSRSEQPLVSAPREPVPADLPGIMPSLRVREETGAGVLALEVACDPDSGQEREISARLERGSEASAAELGALCRLFSLWLRAGGSFETALEHLSASAAPRGSLAQGLEQALRRYRAVRQRQGLARGRLASTADSVGPQRLFGACPMCQAALPPALSCPGCPECGWSPC
jgi:ribonucleoside-diphosphate reductase alpha chain